MKNIKNKLIVVLTSATLAAGLTVSASAQSFPIGTSCSGGGGDWNAILSNEGSSNCLSDSGNFGSLCGSDFSGVLSSSDLKSLVEGLYSDCPSESVCDSTEEFAETQPDTAGAQTDTAGASQTCPNTAEQEIPDKQSTANVQAAAGESSCPTAAPEQTSNNAAAVEAASAPSEKAVKETTTASQTASAKTAAAAETTATTEPAEKPESAVQDSSAPTSSAASASGICNAADNEAVCNTDASQASGNTLMQCINRFLEKCGIDLSSLGITLPGCGNTTVSAPASNGTDETAQQPDRAGDTSTAGSSADTATPAESSGSGQSSQTTAPSSQSDSGSSNTQNVDNLSFEEQVAALVNEQRAANGLQPLTLSTALSNAARIKSQDMHDNQYFAHESPTYGSPFDMLTSFGISYRTAGDNIAMGYATPEAVMNAWMNSSGHRANILNASYTQIGVGYVADGNYWTQEFTG